jgi:hypothetical protein
VGIVSLGGREGETYFCEVDECCCVGDLEVFEDGSDTGCPACWVVRIWMSCVEDSWETVPGVSPD